MARRNHRVNVSYWSDFEPPPIENAETIAAALKRVKKMTPDEVLQSSVRLGIHNHDGSLTPEYGGKKRRRKKAV